MKEAARGSRSPRAMPPPHRRLAPGAGAASLCLCLAFGCAFRSGEAVLEDLKKERSGAPYAITVFRTAPGPDERPMAELRRTLGYWAAPLPDGVPRRQGVLVTEPVDLHERLIRMIDEGASAITLIAYLYDRHGPDAMTLVEYYDADGIFAGWDYVPYAAPPRGAGAAATSGYEDLAWWEYPQLALDMPVYLVLGLKELAGEIVKSPLSALDVGWVGGAADGRSPLSPVCFERAGAAAVEDWRNGLSGFLWRFRVRSRHTPLDLVLDLASAAPVIGPAFDHADVPPERAGGPPAAVIVSQGIHAGGDEAQLVAGWARALGAMRPECRPIIVPYRYGGVVDVAWSLLNLSHGMAYDAAERIVFEHGVGRGDGAVLAGFSGGAQRLLVASRLLRDAGVSVRQYVGVVGPCAGHACAREAWLLVGDDALDDPVLLSVYAADVLMAIVPSDVTRRVIRGAGEHLTPGMPDGATRAPAGGYLGALGEIVGRAHGASRILGWVPRALFDGPGVPDYDRR